MKWWCRLNHCYNVIKHYFSLHHCDEKSETSSFFSVSLFSTSLESGQTAHGVMKCRLRAEEKSKRGKSRGERRRGGGLDRRSLCPAYLWSDSLLTRRVHLLLYAGSFSLSASFSFLSLPLSYCVYHQQEVPSFPMAPLEFCSNEWPVILSLTLIIFLKIQSTDYICADNTLTYGIFF